MYPERIYLRRLERFTQRLFHHRYGARAPLKATIHRSTDGPRPHSLVDDLPMRPIEIGTRWGELWNTAWFRFSGTIPPDWPAPDTEIVALVDIGAEGCVVDVAGKRLYGLTYKNIKEPDASFLHIKRRIPLFSSIRTGNAVEFFVDASANGLFGEDDRADFVLRQAELSVFRPRWWQLHLDVAFLIETAKALPDNHPRRHEIIGQLNEIANRWDPEGEDDGYILSFRDTGTPFLQVPDAPPEEIVRAVHTILDQPAESYHATLWAIGHAHLDLGWLWPVSESRRKGARTFATALQLLDEYPEYRFGASQPQLYEWIEEDDPELFSRVKAAIAAGRWEPQGAMWVEPDTMVTGGESLVRHCLYGKRYFQERFGADVDTLWLPDAFGFSPSLPQILQRSGVTHFVTQKISWNEVNTFPHRTFHWHGLDGSSVLTHFLPSHNYNAENRPAELLTVEARTVSFGGERQALQLYGIGDGGGGPSRTHIEYARRSANTAGLPRLRQGSSREFFAAIEDAEGDSPVTRPSWVGELYLEFHRGTLTSQSEIKRLNRRLEESLRDTELLASIAAVYDAPYPKARLDAIWKKTLLNQFHDILPGSSIRRVYEVALRESEENLAALETLQRESLTALFSRSTNDTPGGAPSDGDPSGGGATENTLLAVVNTLSWERTSLISIASTAGVPVEAESGAPLPYQIDRKTCTFAIDLPSLGYKTVRFVPALIAGEPAMPPAVTVTADSLRNEFVSLRLGESGEIASLYDSRSERETFPGGANRLLLWEDRPYDWDAWDISNYYTEGTPETARLITRRVVLDRPLKATIEQELSIGRSSIIQRISLEASSPTVTIENTVVWREKHKMLRVHGYTDIRNDYGTFEMQFGHIKRPNHENTPWDRARFEVAAHRYADISEPGFGCALLNDSKYGHRIIGGSLELTLLRAPTFPDRHADEGTHRFTFAYLPHSGDPQLTTVIRESQKLNISPVVCTISGNPATKSVSWCTVDNETIVVDTIKRAEDSGDLIVRIHETSGTHAKGTLSFELPVADVYETDLLERTIRSVRIKGRSMPVTLAPFEIRTYRCTVSLLTEGSHGRKT